METVPTVNFSRDFSFYNNTIFLGLIQDIVVLYFKYERANPFRINPDGLYLFSGAGTSDQRIFDHLLRK